MSDIEGDPHPGPKENNLGDADADESANADADENEAADVANPDDIALDDPDLFAETVR